MALMLYFNSKVVRLKVALLLAISACVVAFQFQSGSIKSVVFKFLPTKADIFQFQSGSIKSVVRYQKIGL